MTEARSNIAAFKVTLDGTDLTDKIAPRLLSLSLTEKRGGEADQLDIVMHDADGRLVIPNEGAVIRVQLGWKQGADVRVGLVDKGRFKVDEAEWSGPPDTVTVRARSADLTADYRVRREKSWKDTTVGAIVREIAGRHGLEARISPELASIEVKSLGQDEKSDMALVRELGRRHDAVATVKNRRLIFAARGKAMTASGKTLPTARIEKKGQERYSFRRVERSQAAGVEARWYDQGAAERKTVKAGGGGKGKAKRLKRIYGSEAEAREAAQAEAKSLARGAAEFDLDLPLGRADLAPEQPVTLSGFKTEPDTKKWIIAELTHSFDGQGGFKTKLKLETAG